MSEFDFDEIKKSAIAEFKRKNKELEAWLMKPVSEYNKDGKGIFEQLQYKT